MAYREFTDAAGVSWQVWDNYASPRITLGGAFEDGWLTFESSSGVHRRLAPIPLDWSSCADAALDVMCRAAAGPSLVPRGATRVTLGATLPRA